MEGSINNGSTRHYKPPFSFGMGGVPLGNEFTVVTIRCIRHSRSSLGSRCSILRCCPLVWSWPG